MPVTLKTLRKLFRYPEKEDFVTEGATNFEQLAKDLDLLNEGQQDFLQAGVVAAGDWSFTAAIVAGTGELESSGEVVESTAWLPDPVTTGALMRSVTPKRTIAKAKPATLPAAGKYMAVAFELKPTTWNAEAASTLHSGTEQATLALAEANPPAQEAGKLQTRIVYILNTAGVYSIAGQRDVRTYAGNRTTTSSKLVVGTAESTTSAAYTLLPTPDEVTVVVPATNSLIMVAYSAQWQETVVEAARVAIFLGANQLRGQGGSNQFPKALEIGTNNLNASVYSSLTTGSNGLASSGGSTAPGADVTTGQLVGNSAPTPIFAAAGTYKVSVQFKVSSGSVTVKERKLWAWVIS